MIGRVSVKSSAAKEVVPLGGGELTGSFEFTILNTDTVKNVELVESSGAGWGTGYPLSPGAAWSGVVSSSQRLWVIAEDSTAIVVAVIGVALP